MPRQSAPVSASSSRQALELQSLAAARALVDRMRVLYRVLERRSGAPIAAHRALACVVANPGLRASQLAALLGVKRPAVSHLLKSMMASGWITRTRSKQDQRYISLAVTAAGRRIVGATAGRVAGTLQRAVQQLNGAELADLAHGLTALLARLPGAARATV